MWSGSGLIGNLGNPIFESLGRKSIKISNLGYNRFDHVKNGGVDICGYQ